MCPLTPPHRRGQGAQYKMIYLAGKPRLVGEELHINDRSEEISSWAKVGASLPASGGALRLVVSLLQSIFGEDGIRLPWQVARQNGS